MRPDDPLRADVQRTDRGCRVTTKPGTIAAGVFDFAIEAGRTLYLPITWYEAGTSPKDLTGYTAKLEARLDPTDDDAVLELSQVDGITLGGAEELNIEVRMPAAATAALSFVLAAYDLVLTADDGTATRLLEGALTLRTGVSR